jgi:hypothetical protein
MKQRASFPYRLTIILAFLFVLFTAGAFVLFARYFPAQLRQDFDRFYNDKSSLKYWDIHKDISKINPGDILVIVYDDGNGHMMIVDKVLARSESTLDLRIVDSTRLHHKNDTRKTAKNSACHKIKVLGHIQFIVKRAKCKFEQHDKRKERKKRAFSYGCIYLFILHLQPLIRIVTAF